MAKKKEKKVLDLRKSKILDVEDPFLFVDRIVFYEFGKKVIGEKDITGKRLKLPIGGKILLMYWK